MSTSNNQASILTKLYFPPILPIKSIPNWLESISSQEIHKYQIVLTCIVCHTFVRNTTHKNEFKRFFLFYEKSIFLQTRNRRGRIIKLQRRSYLAGKKKPGPLIINTRPPFPSPKHKKEICDHKHQTPLCTCDIILFLVYAIGWALVPLTSFQML